jgi:hypothetical protein
MATYLELYALRNNADLMQRLIIAILVAANSVRLEASNTPFHSNRVAWAQNAVKDPDVYASKALYLLLAQNKALTVAQIQSVTDTAIQTAVDELVNTLTGLN